MYTKDDILKVADFIYSHTKDENIEKSLTNVWNRLSYIQIIENQNKSLKEINQELIKENEKIDELVEKVQILRRCVDILKSTYDIKLMIDHVGDEFEGYYLIDKDEKIHFLKTSEGDDLAKVIDVFNCKGWKKSI